MKYLGLHLNDENNKIIKVRIANTDTRMGKSNGYRMIYYAIKEDLNAYLLSIYCFSAISKYANNGSNTC